MCAKSKCNFLKVKSKCGLRLRLVKLPWCPKARTWGRLVIDPNDNGRVFHQGPRVACCSYVFLVQTTNVRVEFVEMSEKKGWTRIGNVLDLQHETSKRDRIAVQHDGEAHLVLLFKRESYFWVSSCGSYILLHLASLSLTSNDQMLKVATWGVAIPLLIGALNY